MYPHYKSMDSYPHQRNQMPPTHPYFPSFDPARSYVPYESSPYGCNYGYPMPGGFHGCCNHSYFPGYYSYRPPHSHFQPASPYPVLPETYPFHYASPPHFPMEQPRYEYDKNGPRDHFCGCPHHLCKSKEDSNVKIEEHEPDVEKKSGNSLVPMEFRDNPYPVVWIPSGYMKTKENGKPIDSELKAREENGNLKSPEEEPKVWNGLFPFDINSCGPMKYGGDGKRIGNEESNRFPFPIFWMPCKPDETESKDHVETETGKKSIEELPSNGDRMIQPWETKEKPGSEVDSKKMEKIANQKTIPVKQLGQHKEKRTSESVDKKAGGITVKHIEGNGEQRPLENGVKRHPSSPKNASKLPPVCLRVDPLPKRKNGSPNSRSPSPPGLKRSSELHSETSKNTQQEIQCMNSPLHETKQAEPSETDKKVIEAAEGMILQDEGGENCSNSTHEDVSESQITFEGEKDTEERKPGDGESEIKEEKGTRKVKEEKFDELVKAKSKKFSETEAAVIIQSSYRGFEVRKSESLKKLKQIAQVQEEMVRIKNRIQALQSSGIESDDREKLVIGETIMNLLLKLDTIQGLHPSLRDVRKSAAKELVNMHETLDSLTISKSGVSTAKTVEDLSNITGDDLDFQEEQKEAKEVGLEDNFSQGGQNYKSDPTEHCQAQPRSSTHEESSEVMVIQKEESEGLTEGNLEMNQFVDKQIGVLVDESASEEPHRNDQIGQGKDMVSQVLNNASKGKLAELEDKVGSGKDESFLEDGKLEIEALGKELGDIDELEKVSELEGENVGSNEGIEEITVQQEIDLGNMGDLNGEHEEDHDDKVGSKQEIEEIPVQQEMGDMGDLVEASKPEEIPYNGEHEDDHDDKVGSNKGIEEITVQQEMCDLVEASKQEKIPPKGENEDDHENIIDASGKLSSPQASEPKKTISELSSMENEINVRDFQEDNAITDANDNSPLSKGTKLVSQEKEVSVEERRENCAKVAIGEEHQGCGLGSELGSESGRKLIDENERLRKMMEKLIETGQEQLTAIANLNGRVKDLEKKLAKKKSKTRRFRAARTGSSCVKTIQ